MLVKQQVELLEIISGFEGQNKYKVLNLAGQEIFKGKFKNIFLVKSQMCISRFRLLTRFLFIFSQPKKKMIVVPEIASELVGLLIWKLLNLMDTKMKLSICTDPIDVLPLVVVVVSSNRWKSILHLELWLDQLNENGNYFYNSKLLYIYLQNYFEFA